MYFFNPYASQSEHSSWYSFISFSVYNDSVIRMFPIRTHFNGYQAVRINQVWLYMLYESYCKPNQGIYHGTEFVCRAQPSTAPVGCLFTLPEPRLIFFFQYSFHWHLIEGQGVVIEMGLWLQPSPNWQVAFVSCWKWKVVNWVNLMCCHKALFGLPLY